LRGISRVAITDGVGIVVEKIDHDIYGSTGRLTGEKNDSSQNALFHHIRDTGLVEVNQLSGVITNKLCGR